MKGLFFSVLIFFSKAFDCPNGTDHQVCGTACPNTCSDQNAASVCTEQCHETCACRTGQVLDGDKCVPLSECGCKLPNGVYINVQYFFHFIIFIYIFFKLLKTSPEYTRAGASGKAR